MSEVGAFEIPSCRHGDLWSQAGSRSNADSPHPQAEEGAATAQAAVCWCSWLWLKKWSAGTFCWTSRPGPLWNKLFQILEVGLKDASIVPLTSVLSTGSSPVLTDWRWQVARDMGLLPDREKSYASSSCASSCLVLGISKSLFETGIFFPTHACTFSPLAIPNRARSFAAFNLETSVACFCILPSPALPILMGLKQFTKDLTLLITTWNSKVRSTEERVLRHSFWQYIPTLKREGVCCECLGCDRVYSLRQADPAVWALGYSLIGNFGHGFREGDVPYLQHHQQVPEWGQGSLYMKIAECRKVVNTHWPRVLG